MIWDFWSKYYDRLWVQKVSLEPTRRCVKKILKENNVNSGNILDMGCGTGQLIKEINKEFDFDLHIGIDFSPEMIAKAKENENNIKINWIVSNVEEISNLSLPKCSAIICTHSIPYYKNQAKAIHDMVDLLDDNGILIVACASMNSFWDVITLSFVKLTTGLAHYPSINKLKDMANGKVEVIGVHNIKERWYMPTIVGIVYRRV